MESMVRKRWVPTGISLMITAACLFGAGGSLEWWNAWMLLALSLATGVALTSGRDEKLDAERRNIQGGKSWDKHLVAITVLVGPMATWIIAGLDYRFQWSKGLPSAVTAAGIAIAALGSGLLVWAMRSNPFFSAVVRIQKDRGHRVAEGGPYQYIRHPGYAGMILFTLATPAILGSPCALLPAAVTAGFGVARTALEDTTLRNELDGYSAYGTRVRYRLLPSIW